MAEEAAEEKKPAAPAGVLPTKMVIIIAVVVLLIGAGGAVAFMSMTKGHDKPAGEQEAAEGEDSGGGHDKGGGHEKGGAGAKGAAKGPGPMFDLDPFLVNLTDPNDPHYLKLTLKLELDKAETAELLSARMPQLRDAILILLSSRDSESVRTAQGKLQLREELLTKVNSLLPKGGVKGAYFTDFIVQ